MQNNMSDFVRLTSLKGLYKVERETNVDERGFFREVFHLDELEEVVGEKINFIQMNHSLSKPNVLRALHGEHWNKLIYPVTGKMFAAVVDIRPQSETFGKHEIFQFTPEDRYALFIPVGFANSICNIGEEDVNYVYLVDKYYDGSDTTAIAFDDPDLGIDWPIKDPILSQRDKNNPKLRDLFPEKFR